MESSYVWAMTPDQKAYYLAQFLRLQPDPSGKLSGQSAKAFFELSRLPVADLSQIWELSDVDADGQLSLSEFSVAMHLVVLCRNGIPMPPHLPDSLRAVATSCALSAPPQSENRPKEKDAKPLTGFGERKPRLMDHHSFDSSAFSEAPAATGSNCRRWSNFSPSTAEDVTDITAFDGRLIPNAQVCHPIAIRANPVAIQGAHRAPTPPPRARAKVLTSDAVVEPHHQQQSSNAKPNITSHQAPEAVVTDAVDGQQSRLAQQLQNNRIQQLTASLLPLQAECEQIARENNALTTQLVGLQKRRIALEILLERLTPL